MLKNHVFNMFTLIVFNVYLLLLFLNENGFSTTINNTKEDIKVAKKRKGIPTQKIISNCLFGSKTKPMNMKQAFNVNPCIR